MWKNELACFLMLTCMAFGSSSEVEAKKLPKNAKPMTAEEIKAIYSGNSANWGMSKAYFASDMRVKGIWGSGKRTSTFSGVWSISENEICMRTTDNDVTKAYVDCWKWWRAGGQELALWSTRFDGTKPNAKTDYYDESKSFRKGDHITDDYAKLGGRFPTRVCIQC